jgi:hypothetical protein
MSFPLILLSGKGVANNIGFGRIKTAVALLRPPVVAAPGAAGSLSPERIPDTLKANWFNGTDLASQNCNCQIADQAQSQRGQR